MWVRLLYFSALQIEAVLPPITTAQVFSSKSQLCYVHLFVLMEYTLRAEGSRLKTVVPIWSTPFDLSNPPGLLLSEQVSLGASEAASFKAVSTSMPRTVRQDAGPPHLTGSFGAPTSSQVRRRMARLWEHLWDLASPTTIKSST